jgi:aspartyl-tRNA(Asn)/glutamyl-tRNA(Gln) amidotransferase subunit A
MQPNKLTLTEIISGYKKKEFKPSELVAAYKKEYEAHKELNAYIEFFDEAEEKARELEAKAKGSQPLWGIPGAIKDNFAVKGKGQTCASHILQGYISPTDSVVVDRLNKNGFINLGRVNMDEMAMGATGRYSYYGPTLNPLDHNRVVGGSSSGSACAVAADMAAFSMGSDTGGSSRLPASNTGICGFKPTYGAIPRSGLAAFAPSLDVPGILAKTPEDIAVVFDAVAGSSRLDESSINVDKAGLLTAEPVSLKGKKIGCFTKFAAKAHTTVLNAFEHVKDYLRSEGAVLIDIDLEVESHLLNIYYTTACSEAASSLSRYDGARYGLKLDAETSDKLFRKTRTEGFGHEVQRRILLGNYFLREENYKDWYEKALHIRQRLRNKINSLTQDDINIFLIPGFNEAALIDAPEEDNYTSDLVSVFANLSGIPALALPVKEGENKLPVSIQLSGAHGQDAKILKLGQMLYKNFK